MSLMDWERSLTSLNLMRSGSKLICLEGWYVLTPNKIDDHDCVYFLLFLSLSGGGLSSLIDNVDTTK